MQKNCSLLVHIKHFLDKFDWLKTVHYRPNTEGSVCPNIKLPDWQNSGRKARRFAEQRLKPDWLCLGRCFCPEGLLWEVRAKFACIWSLGISISGASRGLLLECDIRRAVLGRPGGWRGCQSARLRPGLINVAATLEQRQPQPAWYVLQTTANLDLLLRFQASWKPC